MATANPNWTETASPHPARLAGTAAPSRDWGVLRELRAVLEGMLVQVAPDHHDALDARLRKDLGLD